MNDKIENVRLRIPFSTYDIFGYVIPGGAFILVIFLFEYYLHANYGDTLSIPIHTMISLTFPDMYVDSWIVVLIYSLILLGVAYVAGHIISSVSSFAIDKTLVYKGYGYPYEYLLNIDKPKIERNSYSTNFYRGSFLWINIGLLSCYMFIVYSSSIYFYILLLSILLFGLSFLLKLLFWPSVRGEKRDYFKKYFEFVYAGLYNIFSKAIANYINTQSTFSESFNEKYKEAFKKIFDLDPKNEGSNNYWLSKCYISSKAPVLDSLLVNWLHLYSYARNLSTAFYLSFLYGITSILILNRNADFNDIVILWLPIFCFIVSIIMLTRYYYLYFSYYSKFLFRSFVSIYTMDRSQTNK